MSKKEEELRKRVEKLEIMIKENRANIVRLYNLFNKMVGVDEIDIEQIKKADEEWLNDK